MRAERAGADTFIGCDVKVLASQCAIGEMNSGVAAVHPDPAKSSSTQHSIPITPPILWMMVETLDRKTNRRRTLPLPIPEKFIQIRRNEAVHCAWSDCAFDV